MTLTHGSMFTGCAGLDMAIDAALGATTVWHCEFEPPTEKVPNPTQAGAHLLAYRFPGVPNHGDVTRVDWRAVQPVHIISGGSPCQDLSQGGLRAGMRSGTRSGLWASMLAAIETIRPLLVVWENVRGALSADADCAVEPCPGCVGDGPCRGVLRALGRVLGDLANIGYDASWYSLPASDIGAPHGRVRVFVVAWPADPDPVGGRLRPTRRDDGVWAEGLLQVAAADADGDRREGDRSGGREPQVTADARDRRAAADAEGIGRREGRTEPARVVGGPDAAVCGDAPAADTDGGAQHVVGRVDTVGPDADRCGGQVGVRHEGQPPSPATDAVGGGRARGSQVEVGEAERRAAVAWGRYEPAVRRWERLTRPAPLPWERGPKGGYRLAPRFSEWMMGLPAGHVTDPAIWAGWNPSAARNAQLKLLGNGVVPQQATTGISEALRFAPAWVLAALRELAGVAA